MSHGCFDGLLPFPDIMEGASDRSAIRHESLNRTPTIDKIAIESPLKTSSNNENSTLYGTIMRTPGNDLELMVGMLISSGDLLNGDDIPEINIISNSAHVSIDSTQSKRTIDGTSACGLCGRDDIKIEPISDYTSMPECNIDTKILLQISSMIGDEQDLFKQTGGTHAAASWSYDGRMNSLMEDVGRHNALDKLIGHHRLNGKWPLSNNIVSLSGRISYEMVEKAVMSNIPILISIGSATTAAIDLASFHDMTLIVFARDQRFTCMTGAHRIINADAVK